MSLSLKTELTKSVPKWLFFSEKQKCLLWNLTIRSVIFPSQKPTFIPRVKWKIHKPGNSVQFWWQIQCRYFSQTCSMNLSGKNISWLRGPIKGGTFPRLGKILTTWGSPEGGTFPRHVHQKYHFFLPDFFFFKWVGCGCWYI